MNDDFDGEGEFGDPRNPENYGPPTPWGLLNPLDRLSSAVEDIAQRMRREGPAVCDAVTANAHAVDAKCLMIAIGAAIRALEGSPMASKWMREGDIWPAFVPGGKETGPLWKGWKANWFAKNVGAANPRIPANSKSVFSRGKPATFAKVIIECLENLRIPSPIPLAFFPEAEHVAAVQLLPDLSRETALQWRDAGMLLMKSQRLGWLHWLSRTDRHQTAKTKAQEKADKGAGHKAGGEAVVDELVAEQVMNVFLLNGIRSFLEVRESQKFPQK